MDKLESVLQAVATKTELHCDKWTIELFSHTNLGTDMIAVIREFLDAIASDFGVRLEVVGGGYGSTRIRILVHSSDPDIPVRIMKGIAQDKKLSKLARKAKIDMVVNAQDGATESVPEPPPTTDPSGSGHAATISANGDVNISLDRSNFSLASSELTQRLRASDELDDTARLYLVVEAITRTLEALTPDTARITDPQYSLDDARCDAQILTSEIQRAAPSTAILDTVLSRLANVSSIASLVTQLAQMVVAPVLALA